MLRFIACVVCKHFNLFENSNSKFKTYELRLNWDILILYISIEFIQDNSAYDSPNRMILYCVYKRILYTCHTISISFYYHHHYFYFDFHGVWKQYGLFLVLFEWTELSSLIDLNQNFNFLSYHITILVLLIT